MPNFITPVNLNETSLGETIVIMRTVYEILPSWAEGKYEKIEVDYQNFNLMKKE